MAPTVYQTSPLAAARLGWQTVAATVAAAGAFAILLSLSAGLSRPAVSDAIAADDTAMAEDWVGAGVPLVGAPSTDEVDAAINAELANLAATEVEVAKAWQTATAYSGGGQPKLADGKLGGRVVLTRGESLKVTTTAPVTQATVWGTSDDEVVVNGHQIKLGQGANVSFDPTNVVVVEVVGSGMAPPGAMFQEIVLR